MGRRNTVWNQKTHMRYIREGRGTGDLADYTPWIQTYDFPSKGKTVRVLGKTTGRVHHLLSSLEYTCFLLLDSLPGIEDIKEQYPLPLDKTLLCAARLGYRHPEIHGYPYVMTTDFFYKANGSWHALQVKPSSQLDDARVNEKFAIERAYWAGQNIDWHVTTEKELNRDKAENLKWLHSGEPLDKLVHDPIMREGLLSAFEELYGMREIPFHTIISEIERQCSLIPGTALQIFKELILQDRVRVDLSTLINLADPRIMPYIDI